MSIFTSTRTLATKTPLNPTTDRASAIALLHDHPTFQNFQPLLVGNEVVESSSATEWLVSEATAASLSGVKPEYRVVTVRMPFGPFGSNDIVTTSAFIDTDDGLIIVFQAPMGLYGKDEWEIVPGEAGEGFALLEESQMTGFTLLMPFVVGTKKQSHTELGEAFVQKLVEGK